MSKKPSIAAQIAAAHAAVETEQWSALEELVELLASRRLSKEQRAEVEAFVALLEENAPAYNMSQHIAKYRARYQRSVAASGAKSLNNGDAVAEALEMKPASEVMAIADRLLGAPKGFLSHADRYEKLNEGQKRMNAGNKLRAAVKRGDLDVVDGAFVVVDAAAAA